MSPSLRGSLELTKSIGSNKLPLISLQSCLENSWGFIYSCSKVVSSKLGRPMSEVKDAFHLITITLTVPEVIWLERCSGRVRKSNSLVSLRKRLRNGCRQTPTVGDGLQFQIQGSESVNLIQIILDPCDTYTVKFSRQAGQCVSSRQWRRPISESLTRR